MHFTSWTCSAIHIVIINITPHNDQCPCRCFLGPRWLWSHTHLTKTCEESTSLLVNLDKPQRRCVLCSHIKTNFQGRQRWFWRIPGQYSCLQAASLVLVIYYMIEFLLRGVLFIIHYIGKCWYLYFRWGINVYFYLPTSSALLRNRVNHRVAIHPGNLSI